MAPLQKFQIAFADYSAGHLNFDTLMQYANAAGEFHPNYVASLLQKFKMSKSTPLQVEEEGEPRQAMGYALAMRVLQSDLYAKLDDEERGECDALIRAGVGEPRQGGEPSGLVWSREKPTEQIRAIVCYTPRHGVMLRTVAEFIPHKTVRSEDFLSEDCDPGDCDWYDKEEDCYWVNEGWWESSFVADTNWQLDGEVTHWMPLPPAPRTQAAQPPAEAPEAEQPSLVVGNFRCSEHGPQVPIPACPHCIDGRAPEGAVQGTEGKG